MITYDYDMVERPSAPYVCSALLLSGADPVANGGTEFGIQSGVQKRATSKLCALLELNIIKL
jgi:hypothetical protein